jgi:hypothetical protein
MQSESNDLKDSIWLHFQWNTMSFYSLFQHFENFLGTICRNCSVHWWKQRIVTSNKLQCVINTEPEAQPLFGAFHKPPVSFMSVCLQVTVSIFFLAILTKRGFGSPTKNHVEVFSFWCCLVHFNGHTTYGHKLTFTYFYPMTNSDGTWNMTLPLCV